MLNPTTDKSIDTSSWGPRVRVLQSSPPNTLSAELYERIRADVVGGRLQPGSKLLTAAVKRRYDVGGSPMREALTRLAADGLLKNEGQKGFKVVAVSIGELADIGRLRLELEFGALLESIKRGGVEWEVNVVSQFTRLQHALTDLTRNPVDYADEWETTHRAFHFALLGGCNSPWRQHFCDRIYDQMERYRRLFTKHKNIPSALLSSHKTIMDAALARDAATAGRLLSEHIIFATRQTLADMRKHGVGPAPEAEAAIESLSADDLFVAWPAKAKSRSTARKSRA
ncbi:MAG: FCD domain-containing protein [Steroidobacteraceae bacterium]